MQGKFFSLFCLLTLLLSGQIFAEIVDRIVAVVDKDIITLSDVDEFKKEIISDTYFTENKEEKEALLSNPFLLLQKLIEEKIIAQEIKRLGLALTDEGIETEVRLIEKRNRIDRATLITALKREGVSFEDYKRQLKKQIERRQLLEKEVKIRIQITDDDLWRFYREHVQTEKKYHLRQILFLPRKGEKKEATAERAKKVFDLLKEGKDFSALAKKHSAVNAASGGDLGFLLPSELAPELKEAIRAIKAGSTSPVIKTSTGFHLFKVEAIQAVEGEEHFRRIKEDLRLRLFQIRLKNGLQLWLEQKKNDYFIKIIP